MKILQPSAIRIKHFFALCILIPFVLHGHIAFSQISKDTCVTQKQWQDLKNRMKWLKEANMNLSFNVRLMKNFAFIDTVSKTKDSLVLNFMSKKNTVIKRENQRFAQGSLIDSTVTQYNDAQLVEYTERWTTFFNVDDSTGAFSGPYRLRGNYSYFEYDKEKRVTKHVFHESGITRRVLYTYDSTGRSSYQIFRIKEEDFWDN
jgi:hypothetical protein